MKDIKEIHNPYDELANAIIVQAVNDYRKVIAELKIHPFNHTAIGTRVSVLKFFRSEWYRQLTDIDGELLIKKLNAEVA